MPGADPRHPPSHADAPIPARAPARLRNGPSPKANGGMQTAGDQWNQTKGATPTSIYKYRIYNIQVSFSINSGMKSD